MDSQSPQNPQYPPYGQAPAPYPPKPRYSPNFFVRLLCWFGIYGIGQAPFYQHADDWRLYPIGLWAFIVQTFRLWASTKDSYNVASAVCWGFYIVNLLLALAVPSKSFFKWMLVILAIAITMNIAGCEQAWPEFTEPSEKSSDSTTPPAATTNAAASTSAPSSDTPSGPAQQTPATEPAPAPAAQPSAPHDPNTGE